MKRKFSITGRFKYSFLISFSVFLLGGLALHSQEIRKTSTDSLVVKSKTETKKPLASQKDDKVEMADMFVHPFLTHMSLPDPPGTMSLRATAFQQRKDSTVGQDLGLHFEVGLLHNLGLQIRTDSIKTAPYSEVMLMYSFLHDASFGRTITA